jgi:hypothetical protein
VRRPLAWRIRGRCLTPAPVDNLTTSPCISRPSCHLLAMQAPKRWPESSHADWIAWRDHLDREAAAEPWLRLEADRELARIARCGSWQEKRPAPPLVPLVPERGWQHEH